MRRSIQVSLPETVVLRDPFCPASPETTQKIVAPISGESGAVSEVWPRKCTSLSASSDVSPRQSSVSENEGSCSAEDWPRRFGEDLSELDLSMQLRPPTARDFRSLRGSSDGDLFLDASRAWRL